MGEPRLTPPRRRVLSLLTEAGKPLKAYDLIARFREDGEKTHPPTVYRALDYLERHRLVHRVGSLNAYVRCTGHAVHERDALALLVLNSAAASVSGRSSTLDRFMSC